MNWCLINYKFKIRVTVYISFSQVSVYIFNFHKLTKRECFDKVCVTSMYYR